jgi:hypothetical protein
LIRRKWFHFVLLIALAVGLAAGCPGRDVEPQPTPGDGQQQELDITALTTQWLESSHSNVLLYPAGREGCVVCHDGGAFAEQIMNPEELERDFFVSIDCRACHTGRGVEVMDAGTVSIPTQENVQAGTGALCLTCHNERRAPNIDDEERSAPHYSSQAGVYTGTGGIRREGFNYGNSPHATIENSCVACHMTQAEEGFSSHTFGVEDVEAACARCHQNINTLNLEAKEDYDGDGTTKGFMDETDGLLTMLAEQINESLEGGSFEGSGGKIVFSDADGEVTAVPNEVYMAAYNFILVTQDGSLGIHNPTYAIQLLQQSYRELTGEDVPGATIR